MGLYTGTNPNLQGVSVERVRIRGLPVDLFDVYKHGEPVASELTGPQVEQVLGRIAAGVDPTGRGE